MTFRFSAAETRGPAVDRGTGCAYNIARGFGGSKMTTPLFRRARGYYYATSTTTTTVAAAVASACALKKRLTPYSRTPALRHDDDKEQKGERKSRQSREFIASEDSGAPPPAATTSFVIFVIRLPVVSRADLERGGFRTDGERSSDFQADARRKRKAVFGRVRC